MKRKLLIIALFCITNLFSQNVIITSIIEGNCPTGFGVPSIPAPEIIELYVDGSVDVTDLRLQFQFSFQDFWSLSTPIGSGIVSNDFLYVVNSTEAMEREFPGIRNESNTTTSTILFSVGGGDKIRLVDTSNSDEVIDIYGIDGLNGENETWNFNLSYAQRKNNELPSSNFVESQWDIFPKLTLFGKGECWDEQKLNQTITLQKFTIGNSLSITDFDSDKLSFHLKNPMEIGDKILIDSIDGLKNISIFSLDGKKIITNKNSDISFNFPGIYIVKFEFTTQKIITKKIIVE